ncbi:MAG TPA: DUF2786 domain-containing protein [Nocardioidaceae bacterium]|jgi:hypothetical protein|nr:DUF2786 domain-containing protein [Actinomycetota bacterium]HEV8055814.1 DUF2786 domain-containing protein [Nocardioidaceae bacterium]
MTDLASPVVAPAKTDAVLGKARKLLAKAEDPAATAAEAETYTAKAAALIAAYGIDRALLAAADPGSDLVGDRVVVLDSPYARDKAHLLAGVARQLRCQAVLRTDHTVAGKELSLHLFGHESDLRRAELLFTSLLLQSANALARTPVPGHEQPGAFRRSWLHGFTSAVITRLAAAESAAHDVAERRATAAGGAGRSVALVLADRSAVVAEAMRMHYPRLAMGRRRSLSGSGARQGWNAGQRADLGGTPVGQRSRRAVTAER